MIKDYNFDTDYVYGYFKELSPLTFKFVCLLRGIKPPKIQQACELGYGNGISLNIHASTTDVEWYGTDYSASHANFTSDCAALSGNEAKIYAESFEDFLERKDLPDFDFIGFHGIYSWVNEKNRNILLKFVDKKLRPGGGCYASYNVYPGQSNMVVFRNLLKNFSDWMNPSSRNIFNKIASGFDFFDKLVEAKADFVRENPLLQARVEKLKEAPKAYIVHEFMNSTWEIMDFMQISKSFVDSRLDFISSSNLFSFLENIIYTPEQKALLNSAENILFREYIRDLLHNNSFRKDYWVKGVQRLNMFEQEKLLKETKVILIVPKEDIKLSIEIGLGKIDLSPDFYEPLLDILGNHEPKTLAEIQEEGKGKFERLGELVEATIVLSAIGVLREVQDDRVIKSSLSKAHKFNAKIIARSKVDNQIHVLGSPLIGEGIEIGRFAQLFLQSLVEGKKNPSDYAKYAWDILKIQDEKIIKEGKVLQTEKENLDELIEQAKDFEKRLQIYRNLKILEGI